MQFTHVDENGKAEMVDISDKKTMYRRATATATVIMEPATIDMIKANRIKKGDVLATARIAAIGAGKKTSELIPLCHNIPINKIDASFQLGQDRVIIGSQAICQAKTGIEMEALTAVSVAALTIYDMCKAIDKKMIIQDIKLVEKIKNEI